ncbi:ADP-ribose pyrophosphatase YjhB, NUDIX family [Pseudonocardia ammonioxydans]|uniref:ADP-ribose pyrophosphatase YjhB, NUDIX family n=1 Tax=Pseudonocardia ammonioxydans TaxID=260086 RepID=A0A1I4WPW9_PSUAM|nr:NUDIX domain-containing protein [Pseudonocardia ammonioxydans]SFN15206.1 ADP-ribose pyrophosphatase YjhB, NUDIX family [Pseudonocardia ammonioxydans]
MGRTDYYDDPSAPPANSLVVAVVVVVLDGDRVLMIQRTDNGRWALPGGGQELGESVRDAAVRETWEETGLHIEVTGVVGIYSDPRHVIAYDDGEVRQEFALCLTGSAIGGELQTSSESKRVEWVPLDALPSLDVSGSTRRRIEQAVTGTAPHID